MIIVLADVADQAARRIVARWSSHDARLMTQADLSRPGWRLELGCPSRWTAPLGDELVSDRNSVMGVLNCLQAVDPAGLSEIVPEDRVYVATEMTAFLACWLTELRCTLANRPGPNCLCGPGWRPEHWARVASGLGIPAAPVRRSPPAPRGRGGARRQTQSTVTIAGRACVGAASDVLADRARRLAGVAGLGLATFGFDATAPSAPLLGATPGGDLDDAEVADGLLATFEASGSC